MTPARRALGALAAAVALSASLAGCDPADVGPGKVVDRSPSAVRKLQIDQDGAAGRVWVTVDEGDWRSCRVGLVWPDCRSLP